MQLWNFDLKTYKLIIFAEKIGPENSEKASEKRTSYTMYKRLVYTKQ